MPTAPPLPPHTYPTYRFFSDGRQVVVPAPEAWEALPAGHADSPAGPWPAPPDWPHDKAPFGPADYPWRSLQGLTLVSTRAPIRYGGRPIAPGQLVRQSFRPEDHGFLQDGTVYLVPRIVQYVRHAPTGWGFTDPDSLAEYARRYSAGDVSWWVPEPPQESVSRPLVRPQSDDWQTWTRQETLAVLVEAARKIPHHRRLSWTNVATYMRPKYHRNTLAAIRKKHLITLAEVRAKR